MREIEFRVWDYINDRMLYWGDIFHLPAIEIFPGTPDQRAFDVMQYTGLKDRNDNKVFEGDIILATKDFYGNTEEKIPMVVVFKDGCFMLEVRKDTATKKKGYYYINILKNYIDTEVIGNIYENPKLLKDD